MDLNYSGPTFLWIAAALIHSCVLSAAAVLKLVKPFNLLIQINSVKPPKGSNLLHPTLHKAQLQDISGFSQEQDVLTMKVLAVLLGLMTATLLSGKSGAREEGRESWDKK